MLCSSKCEVVVRRDVVRRCCASVVCDGWSLCATHKHATTLHTLRTCCTCTACFANIAAQPYFCFCQTTLACLAKHFEHTTPYTALPHLTLPALLAKLCCRHMPSHGTLPARGAAAYRSARWCLASTLGSITQYTRGEVSQWVDALSAAW
jgi:hypothetical protein